MFLLSIFMKNHILWPPERAKKKPACCHMKAKKTIEVFSPHATWNKGNATEHFIFLKWQKGHRGYGETGHTRQGTHGTQRDTGNPRDTGHTRQGTEGDTGQPRPQGAFPSPTGPKNGKKKQGSIGPCFTLCIFTFCLHLCLAKDNERLWHYHRIWKRFLCG